MNQLAELFGRFDILYNSGLSNSFLLLSRCYITSSDQSRTVLHWLQLQSLSIFYQRATMLNYINGYLQPISVTCLCNGTRSSEAVQFKWKHKTQESKVSLQCENHRRWHPNLRNWSCEENLISLLSRWILSFSWSQPNLLQNLTRPVIDIKSLS